MANKKNKCCGCKKLFIAVDMIVKPVGKFCTIPCMLAYALKPPLDNAAKVAKLRDKESSLRTRTFNANDRRIRLPATQSAFNAYIRQRDIKDSCISCDRTLADIMKTDGWKTGGAFDCGHYLTRGGFPELRFEELNAHKQCKSCNGGSGKFSRKDRTVKDRYRIKLLAKIGNQDMEWLEGPHEAKKYTCEDLREIEAKYKLKFKQLIGE